MLGSGLRSSLDGGRTGCKRLGGGRGDCGDGHVLLGVDDGDDVRERLLGAENALWVPVAHDLDLDAKDSLAQEDGAHGRIHKVVHRLAGVDHESVNELHALGALAADLARHDNLEALGARLHDVAHDTVARAAHGQPGEELEAQGLALCNGRDAAVLHLLGEELDGALLVAEALLDDCSELADAAAALAEDLLGAGRADDDLRAVRRDADLDAGVALLGEHAREELVELGVEDTVSDELSVSPVEWVDVPSDSPSS